MAPAPTTPPQLHIELEEQTFTIRVPKGSDRLFLVVAVPPDVAIQTGNTIAVMSFDHVGAPMAPIDRAVFAGQAAQMLIGIAIHSVSPASVERDQTIMDEYPAAAGKIGAH